MRKLLLFVCISISISAFGQHAFMEQGVINMLNDAAENELIPVFLVLEDAVNIDALKQEFKDNAIPVSRRPQQVIEALQAKADATQPAVIEFIENSGMTYKKIERFWIANAIAIEATPALINQLAHRSDIASIELNIPRYSLVSPEKADAATPKANDAPEAGLVAIGAPEMWAMGYTGHGRKALTFDTGIWPDHPAIKNRFLANRMPFTATWKAFDSESPTDKTNSHGTHVTGIILGLDTAYNDTIGVAPNAYFIATDPIVSNLNFVKPLSVLMTGFEWAMNPDGDVTTSHDIPDVINNSWGRDNTVVDQDWIACSELVINVMSAVQAAGIANVFSAGNEGPGESTIGIPHNINTGLVNSFTVGAVNGNLSSLPIANFSSRGPSLCDGEGSLLIKPEVVAPGVNVRSAVGNNGEYDIYSGTSMASPHVSGAILLLKEAFPYLSGEELLLALYYSATDLGTPGEDNTFGMGMINVKAAYDYLAENNAPVPPAVKEIDLELLSIDQPTTELRCMADQTIAPQITIRNHGDEDVTGVSLEISVNGGEAIEYQDPQVVLTANADTQIDIPASLFEEIAIENKMELYIYLDTLPGEYDILNNHNVVRWKNLGQTPDPFGYYLDNFNDGITEDWVIHNPDFGITWDTLQNILQADGTTGTVAWIDFRNYNPIAGQKDRLFSPVFKLGSAVDVDLGLDFDYFYRKRTNNVNNQDTLTVYLMSCNSIPLIDGTTGLFNEIFFQKGGEDLYTTTQTPSDNMPQNPEEWRHISRVIDWPSVNNADEYFYLVFEGTNRRGNHLLLDNVLIGETVNVPELEQPTVKLYPNPGRDSFTIETSRYEPGQIVTLYDMYGRKVLTRVQTAEREQINVSHLSKGVYLVELQWKNGTQSVSKIVVQ